MDVLNSPTHSGSLETNQADGIMESFEKVNSIIMQNLETLNSYVKTIRNKHGNTRLATELPTIEKYASVLDGNYCKFQLRINSLKMYVEVLEKAALEKDQEIMRLKAQKFDEYISGSRVTQPLLRSGITKQRERSYAQAAMASAKTSDIKTNHVVILAPRNADMPTYSDTTFKLFKTSVNHEMLKDSKISIQNKKMSTKARVVLTCASQEQCEALCEAVSDDKWIKAVIPKKKDPQVQILGIDESIPKDDVFKLILAQNKDMEEFAQCKFEANFEKMDRIGTKFVVAEVEPKLFKKLIEIGKVCVGYSSCPVKSRIRVVRCFKCNRFGHLKKNCRNETSCTSCGGNHDAKVCKNPVLKCSNCDWINTKRVQRKQEKVNSEHRADDYGCPQYLRMYKIVENQYNFG